MKAKVIINPAAGREEAVLFKMNAFFREHNIDYYVSVTTPRLSAREAAQEALAQDYDVVVAYGGDGTLMEIANVLRGRDMPMLIVPGGTSNTLAQELRIPSTIPKALSLLLPENGQHVKVDMGKFRDTCFVTNLGIGIPAQWAREADRDLKNKYGLLAYLIAGVRATIQSQQSSYHLTLDGKAVHTHGVACAIANIGSIGLAGLRLGKTVSNTDGVLDVLVFKLKLFESNVATIDDLLRSLRSNRRLFFEHYRARDIHIVADPPQSAMIDGEPAGATPLQVTVLPRVLSVYTPKQASGFLKKLKRARGEE